MASIERRVIKRKDGKEVVRYYIRYLENGKRKTLPGGFTRKKDAQAALGRMLAEQAAGAFGKPDQAILFRDVATLWLAKVEPEVGVRTYIDYQQVVENHLLPAFGDKRIKEIRTAEIEAFRNATLSKVSPRTTNKVLRVLKMMFGYADRHQYVAEDPSRHVANVKQTKQEMDFLGRLDPGEIDKFLKETKPEFYPLFVTAIWTGMREGELFALRWGNVDFKRNRINVRETYDKHGYREPKSQAGKRQVVMSPELAKVLQGHREAQLEVSEEATATDSVFQSRNGKPLVASTVVREFQRTLERAGLRKMRFHDLRHTYGALTASMGAPPKFIQSQMGHASLTITLDTYGHLMPSVFGEFGEKFDGFVHTLAPKSDETKSEPAE